MDLWRSLREGSCAPSAHGRGPAPALPVQLGVQRTPEGPHVGEPSPPLRGSSVPYPTLETS